MSMDGNAKSVIFYFLCIGVTRWFGNYFVRHSFCFLCLYLYIYIYISLDRISGFPSTRGIW